MFESRQSPIPNPQSLWRYESSCCWPPVSMKLTMRAFPGCCPRPIVDFTHAGDQERLLFHHGRSIGVCLLSSMFGGIARTLAGGPTHSLRARAHGCYGIGMMSILEKIQHTDRCLALNDGTATVQHVCFVYPRLGPALFHNDGTDAPVPVSSSTLGSSGDA